MANKQDNDKNMKVKKYDKFAIWSFVLSLILPFATFTHLIILSLLSWTNRLTYFDIFQTPINIIFPVSYISSLLSIILGIISLTKISNNKNLKGYLFAILGITIPIFMIMYFIIAFFSGGSLIS